MTCKDCVYHDLCFDNGTLFIHFTTTGRKTENVETNCPFKHFKNKADFVEVVRCYKCKNSIKLNGGYVCKIDNDMVFANHFCGYGDRKDGKDINVPTK